MGEPSDAAAGSRLNAFVPKAGRDYAAKRNYDDTSHVSALSPYIRHRIISEEDVLRAGEVGQEAGAEVGLEVDGELVALPAQLIDDAPEGPEHP